VDDTPSGLISNPPPSNPFFTPDALPATTLPIYPGLGKAQEYAGSQTPVTANNLRNLRSIFNIPLNMVDT